MKKVYFGGAQYSLGSPYKLQDSNLDEETKQMALSSEYGLSNYLRSEQDIFQMASSSVQKTLNQCKLQADQIDVILFSSSSALIQPHDPRLKQFLEENKLTSAFPMMVTMGYCGNFQLAMRNAVSLIKSEEAKTVLVVMMDHMAEAGIPPDESLMVGMFGVFSDAAASCICSIVPENLELQITHPFVSRHELKCLDADFYSRPNSTFETLKILQSVFREAYQNWHLESDYFARLITNSTTMIEANMFAMSAGMKLSKVYHQNIARTGHCFAADALINLRDYMSTDAGSYPQNILFMSAGPSQWGCFFASEILN